MGKRVGMGYSFNENDLKKENEVLKGQVESLKKEIDNLKNNSKKAIKKK